MAEGKQKSDSKTRLRLLETAERLFAERGFSSVSLRKITREADVNVAAVKYHFGSKDELITAVEKRMTFPVNEERLMRLDKLEQEGGYDVRALLRALIEPFMGKLDGSEMSHRLFSQFMARFLMERRQQIESEIKENFQEVARRYVAAFKVVTPWLTASQIIWRIDFSFGVFTNALLHRDILPQIVEVDPSDTEMDILLEKLLDFCVAGFETGKK